MKAPDRKRQRGKPPTAERLRADIDEGRTGEKVNFPDPAAVPLGADDEAAGMSPTADELNRDFADRTRGPPPPREEPGMLVLYAVLIAGIALVVIATLLLLRV